MNENEMKSLENRLRCWQPRRPSAGLKRRIFGARIFNLPRLAKFAGFATPAMACAVLAFSVLNSENSLSTGLAVLPSVTAMISNQDYAVCVASRQSEQNNLCAFTFDWTNGGGFNSNVSSFLHRN